MAISRSRASPSLSLTAARPATSARRWPPRAPARARQARASRARRARRRSRGGHLDQRAGGEQRLQPLAEVGPRWRSGMGDQAPKPAPGERLDRLLEVIARAARAAARPGSTPARPSGHPPQVVLVEAGRASAPTPRRRSRPERRTAAGRARSLTLPPRAPPARRSRRRGAGGCAASRQIDRDAVGAAWRAISTLSSRSRAPSSSAGRIWQWRSINGGSVFRIDEWNSRVSRVRMHPRRCRGGRASR